MYTDREWVKMPQEQYETEREYAWVQYCGATRFVAIPKGMTREEFNDYFDKEKNRANKPLFATRDIL